ncbi:hypothetical protein [Nocardia sp. CWNU-33]|uniref:hypothetical protein n=1 Tax=Nocardia sp. CWNU-33 TaxID=3392117 RepID=UPI00398E3DE7
MRPPRAERDTTGEVAHDHPKPTAMLGRDQLSQAALSAPKPATTSARSPTATGIPARPVCRSWMPQQAGSADGSSNAFGDHVGLLVAAPEAGSAPPPRTLRYSGVSRLRPGHEA